MRKILFTKKCNESELTFSGPSSKTGKYYININSEGTEIEFLLNFEDIENLKVTLQDVIFKEQEKIF